MSPPHGAELLEHFRARHDALASELASLVRFDSPTGQSQLVERLAAHCATELEKAGLRAELIPDSNGPHVFAELPGSDPALVLSGHTDTVWPTGEPERRPPRIENGR